MQAAAARPTRCGPRRSTIRPATGPASAPRTAPAPSAAAITLTDVPVAPRCSGTSRSTAPNVSRSISVSESAARVADWRIALASAWLTCRGAPTWRPAGASAESTTPTTLTAATSPNASPCPAQAATAPTAGPAIDPAESIPITMPDSRPRRPGSALSVTQAIDPVQIDPLANPWTSRAVMSTPAFGAHAKMTVATDISAADASVIRLAPIRGTRTMQPSDTNGTEIGYAATTTPAWNVLSPNRSTYCGRSGITAR